MTPRWKWIPPEESTADHGLGLFPLRDRYGLESPIRAIDHIHDPDLLWVYQGVDLILHPPTTYTLQLHEPIRRIDAIEMILADQPAVLRKGRAGHGSGFYLPPLHMRPFLERLAEQLLEHHRHEMDRIAVVLPGRRAGVHLRKYLAKANGGPLWSPEILDMGAFAQRASGLAQGGSMELLFLLYETYSRTLGTQADPFVEFLEWAPTAIRDMSEVDAHLIDRSRFYRDLRDYHELDEWSFRLGELSPGQQRLNAQWRATGELHEAYAERLNELRMGTSGSIARFCAEGGQAQLPDLPWRMVWFAGLNALDPASTRMIRTLQLADRARVAWDSDPHYLNDPRQEAGRYLRRSIGELGEGELPAQADIVDLERTIRKVAAPHAVAQTSYVAQRLAELSAEERARTAVVLADEGLLLPLLEQLPSDIGPLNITMGMPLSALPVNGLTESFLDLLEAFERGDALPLDRLERFLSHPFMHQGVAPFDLVSALRTLQQSTVTASILVKAARQVAFPWSEELAASLSRPTSGELDIAERMVALIDLARKCAPQDRSVKEQLFQIAQMQQRLDRMLTRVDLGKVDVRTYATIRMRLLREERIAFLGEPLQGLQVMGLLETRALAHERLMMVSVNEGVIPRAAGQQSWIPFDLRRHHKLPLPADGESISAYHFHRAMQHANAVEWVYVSGDADAGEPSRFTAQWEKEVIGHSNTELTSTSVAPVMHVRNSRAISVIKDAAVMDRLNALCERGLSPSALGTWLRCPLDFYFRYVLGIRDTDAVDGLLGSDVLGNAVHSVLQSLLTPTIGQSLTSEQVLRMVPEVHRLLTDELSNTFPRSVLEQGHFKLRREMASSALETYLKAEAERCNAGNTTVLGLEMEVQARLQNGVLLKGRLDRIDDRNGMVTVLDVKTGSVQAQDLRLAELTRDAITPNRRYALQLLIYSWAYLEQHPSVQRVTAGILPLQRPTQASADELTIGRDAVMDRSKLPEVSQLLTSLVNDILDPAMDFTHDLESSYCRCCVA